MSALTAIGAAMRAQASIHDGAARNAGAACRRGGEIRSVIGSADDLALRSSERVSRTVAGPGVTSAGRHASGMPTHRRGTRSDP